MKISVYHWLCGAGGILLIAVCYLALLWFSVQILPLDTNAGLVSWPPLYQGILLATLPYIVGGMLLGRLTKFDSRSATIVGLVATVGERCLILGAAALVLGNFRQIGPGGEVYYVEGNANLLTAIQSEALPFFTPLYIIAGIPVSLVCLLLTIKAVRAYQSSLGLAV